MASFIRNIWFIIGVIAFVVAIIGLIIYFLFGYRNWWVWILIGLGAIVGIGSMILAFITSRGEQLAVVETDALGPVEFGADTRGVWIDRRNRNIDEVVVAKPVVPVRRSPIVAPVSSRTPVVRVPDSSNVTIRRTPISSSRSLM